MPASTCRPPRGGGNWNTRQASAVAVSFASPPCVGAKTQNHPAGRRGGFVSGDQIFVTILMPGPMVDAVTQDLMYWPFEAAGLALMIAPMSAL